MMVTGPTSIYVLYELSVVTIGVPVNGRGR